MNPEEKIPIITQVAPMLDGCTQKEKLDLATWIVLSCLQDSPIDMTEGFHRLDVLTRHVGDVMTQARGILGRYGNKGDLNK
jgi:hypothetical protein